VVLGGAARLAVQSYCIMSPSACGAGGAARLAVQSYLAGEALCDQGHFQEGIKLIRRALDAQPELDADEWPAWASELRLGLERAAVRPPPYAVADFDLGGGDIAACQADDLAAAFAARHFVVIDGVMPLAQCEEVRDEIMREDESGELEPARVYTSPNTHAVSVAVPERRSDRVKYLNAAADAHGPQRWRTISQAVDRIDAIVRLLRDRLPGELGTIESRQLPMIACYGEGCRFERHCDNHCDGDEDEYDPQFGHCANRRRLSAVLYCVPSSWCTECGGALRVYQSTEETGGWEGDDALVDVLPRPARLVLFASDQRVPHEVLPVAATGVVRHSLALWFLGPRADASATSQSDPAAPQPLAAKDVAATIVGDGRRGERASDTSVIAELG